ncbi:MAG: hypothetical protein KC493_08110 [Bacteriovoracaceae bacterium]|nr:hypothetical protein [Bacteriovoracaceae bacterium]
MKILILLVLSMSSISHAFDCTKTARENSSGTYLIGFEGLASYNKKIIRNLKRHHESLKAGKHSTFKKMGTGGFLTKHFISKFVEKSPHQFEFFVFPQKIKSIHKIQKADQCIKEIWNETNGQAKLVLLGHSFGGFELINVAKRLNKYGITFDVAVTMDARAYPAQYKRFIKPDNIKELRNYYQIGLLSGHKIKQSTRELKLSASHVGILTKVFERYERSLID